MEKDALKSRLLEVAKFDLKHKHYAHTVKKRQRYLQLVAGIGIDKLLRRFVKRESAEMFEQRVRLTQHIVTSVCHNLFAPMYKIPRSNSARRTLTYDKDSKGEQIKELEGILKKFNGDASFDEYLATDAIDEGKVDPNGFKVIEWDDFDNEKELIQPRPFKVTSEMAVDYVEKNRTLEYLIVRQNHNYISKNLKEEKLLEVNKEKIVNTRTLYSKGARYTIYGKNQTLTLTQVHPYTLGLAEGTTTRDKDTFFNVATVNTEGKTEVRTYIRLKEKYFQYVEIDPHNCGVVPAVRNGWIKDLATSGETYVNMLHAVEPYLLKTIKVNSELDLVAALLAFPQLIRYNTACPDPKCYSGEYENGMTCGTCGGTGLKKTAPSAQDSIELPLPDSKEEMIPLSDIAKYLSPDVDIVKWQDEYIDKLTEKCKQLLYNSDTFSPKQTAKTATGTNLDMQNVYDTLYPFSVHYSKSWKFGVKLIAKLADRDKGLVVNHTFGKDFKLKTLDTLIQDLERVSKIGSTPALKRHINDDIAQIIYSENPIEHLRYQLKEFYNPFSGKTEKEIMYLLGSRLVPMRDKLLYANSGSILDSIELRYSKESKDFYALKRSDQLIEINKELDVIQDKIKQDSPEPNNLDLT